MLLLLKRSLKLFLPSLVLVSLAAMVILTPDPAYAASGINSQVNFQGKVVNKTSGTNVTNGSYNFTFKIYDAGSGGSLIWTENYNTTNGNQLTVTDGIFRASLGSVCSFSGGSCQGNTNSAVNFNSDSLYLDITFNGETMGTRVRFTAVPYAFNAEKVSGLTVTNNGGNTLNIAANKTLTVNNTIAFSGTDSTTFTLPSGSDTLVSLTATQSLTNKTIGSTGLTFSGAATDITTGTNEDLVITPNGSGKVGIGVVPTGFLHVGKSTLSSNPLVQLDATQTGVNTTDTNDMGLSVNHTISASSASNELVQRGILVNMTNTLTGGGAVSNLRGLNIKANTSASTVTTALDNIYIENGTTSGVVQDSRGMLINGLQGTNRAGIAINTLSGTNNSYLILGQTAIPSGNFGIYNASLNNNYFAGNVGIGSSAPTAKLFVTGAPAQGGNALAIFNQTNADDILTASASGASRFVVRNNGTIVAGTDVDYAINNNLVLPNTIAHFTGNTNNYAQINAQNRSNGASASTDYVATADNGNDTTNYIDFGINSSAYNNASYTIGGANTGYLYNNGADLTIGTQTSGKSLIFHTSGTLAANERMRIDGSGNVGIGLTAPTAKLHISGAPGQGGNALAIFNQTNSDDILAASASGTTRFKVSNAGDAYVTDSVFSLQNANNFLDLFDSGVAVSSYLSATYKIDNDNNDTNESYTVLTNGGQSTLYTVSQSGNTGNAARPLVGIGTAAPAHALQVSTWATGKALVAINDTSNNGGQNLFTASVSGTTKFTIDTNGNVGIAGSTVSSANYITAPNFVLNTSGQISTGTWQASAVGTQYGGTGQNFSATTQGNILYFSGAGTMAALGPSTAGKCLVTNGVGANPSWSSTCGSVNWWNMTNGAINPINTTLDLLLGSTATASAKFAFINVNSGTPIASVSAGTSGALTFSANGTIATTAKQSLVLGDANTGNIGIGDTTPLALLTVGSGDLIQFASNGSIDDNSTLTTGTIFSVGTNTGVTMATSGTLAGGLIDFNTNYTRTNASFDGLQIELGTATTNTDTTGTNLIRGLKIGSSATLTQNGAGGTTTFRGADFTLPNITGTAGTISADGLTVTTGTVTTAGTMQGLNIAAQGVGAGTLNGINISSITAGAGTETGITIGSGWDKGLSITTSAAETGIQVTAGAVPTTDMVSISNSGQGITTAGVGNLQLTFVGGAANVEASSARIDLTPGGTSGGVWNGLRFVANATGPATGVTETGVKIEGPTAGGAGTFNGINIANIGKVTTNGTTNGISITGTNSQTAGTQVGIAIAALTAGAATERAMTIGKGWDASIAFGALTANDNTAQGSIMFATSGNGATACAINTDQGLVFRDQAGTRIGHFCKDGSTGMEIAANSTLLNGTDVAENYSDVDDVLEPGDVVSLDESGRAPKAVKKSTGLNDQLLFGIVSTEPGVLLSDIDESNGATDLIHPKMIGLTGRVPTKVTTENGEIKIGDYLTSSSIPGVAMKATKSGFVVGRAIQAFNGQGTGKILAFVQHVWYEPGAESTTPLPAVAGAATGPTNDNLTTRIDLLEASIGSMSAMLVQKSEPLIATPTISFTDGSIATVSGKLRVKNSALFEDMLTVIDTIMTKNLIVSGLSTFMDDVVFKKHLTVSEDTVGVATIKKGEKSVTVTFKNPYEQTPVVTTQHIVATESDDKASQDAEQQAFAENVHVVITRQSEKGFTIMVDKDATEDIQFSWTAFGRTPPTTSAP